MCEIPSITKKSIFECIFIIKLLIKSCFLQIGILWLLFFSISTLFSFLFSSWSRKTLSIILNESQESRCSCFISGLVVMFLPIVWCWFMLAMESLYSTAACSIDCRVPENFYHEGGSAACARKLPDMIDTFSKVTESTKTSSFQIPITALLRKKWGNAPSTIASKKWWTLGIELSKEVKGPLQRAWQDQEKETKEESRSWKECPRSWKERPCSWLSRIGVVQKAELPRVQNSSITKGTLWV